MSVEFVSGKPGGGKTLFAVELIVKELVKGRRVVVTNVPLLLPELNEYLQREHPEASVDLFERVEILDEDNLGEFFKHRGPGRLVAEYQSGKNDGLPNYGSMTWQDQGVFYVLDEIHIAFNARAWMKTGPGAIYYLSQHRKLSDDVIAITQSIPNVDKQFRSVAQAFHYLRNQAKETYRGFKLPSRFVRKSYLQPATGQNDTPYEVTSYRFPLKLAGVYNTAAGIGITGQAGADTAEKRRGIPWQALALPIALVACAMFYIPDLIGAGVSGVVNADMVSFKPSESTRTAVKPAVPLASEPSPGETRAIMAGGHPRLTGAFCDGVGVFVSLEGQEGWEEVENGEDGLWRDAAGNAFTRAELVKLGLFRPRPKK